MSTLALQSLIGRQGLLSSDRLRFQVTILDAKLAYGNTRLLVEPVAGSGQVWVDSSRVQINKDSEGRGYETRS